jgi:hypothetical protein
MEAAATVEKEARLESAASCERCSRWMSSFCCRRMRSEVSRDIFSDS